MTDHRPMITSGMTWLALAIFLSPLAARAQTPRDFTLLFVGGSAGDGTTPTLERLEERLAAMDPESAVVVFTGNYSSAELPAEGEPGRAKAENDILAHVAATKDFFNRGGKVYFLTGDRDFPDGGTKAARRLRKFLNRSFEAASGNYDKNFDVMPEAACGTPTQLDLTGNLGLLLVNSQWWMQDRRNDPEANEGCDVMRRRALHERLMDAFRDHRNKRLVVASHHPLDSYEEPITANPLELIGRTGLLPQYPSHPMVHSYVTLLYAEAQRNGAYIFASGHSANLQYLRRDKQTQIVSGTSAKTAKQAVKARGADFAAATPGWAEVTIDPTGAGEVHLFSSTAEQIYETPLPGLTPLAPAPVAAPAPLPKGPVMATYSKKNVWHFPGIIEFMLGTYYSDAFALKLPYDVLDLQTEEGGLVPYKMGGGLQTNSIRLRDSRGGDWSIRSTTKDASRLTPYPLNEVKPIDRLLEHGFTGTHPEAALSMARLSEAAGVLHLRPRLMYLPDQAALGEYRGFITDEVVLLEQRPYDGAASALPEHIRGTHGDGEVEFKKYDTVIERLMEKPATHRLDQEAMLRARLLDMFVGDWDRHRGQWRFAVSTGADGVKTYAPIGLDRDQAFANYDGVGLMVARMIIPRARALQPFTGNYGRIGWLNYDARDVDALMLNQLPYDRWMAIAAEVQGALTDPVIDEAFSMWHPEAYALDGARIAAALKERRDKLGRAADEFYGELNKRVDVMGSAADDVFDLTFRDNGDVQLAVRLAEKGSVPYFDRVFHEKETDELRVYALDGDDVLAVHGTPHTIGIRFVGGEGKDLVTSASGQPISARAIALYDSETGAEIDPSIKVRDERSEVSDFNLFDPRDNHEPDYGFFVPGLYYNYEDGVFIGGRATHVIHSFKKRPFAVQQNLSAYYATSSSGVAVDYNAIFPQSVALLDQQIELTVRTPLYTRNFFGFTNTYTSVDDADDPDFYRVRQARYEGRYAISHGFGPDQRARIGLQALAQAIVTERTPGRFVTLSPDVTQGTFGPRYFAGGRVFAGINTFDNLSLPRRGLQLGGSVEARTDLEHGSQLSTSYRAGGAVAIPFDRRERFVLLSRARVEGIAGEHLFYFAPTLGRPDLRGYREEQLAGTVAFSQTSDLRIDVLRVDQIVPGTVGVNLSLDHGRVFGPTINDDTYHVSYGGGLWWSIVDTYGIAVGYHRGIDGGSRFSLDIGALFYERGL